ncbi:MAG TPA: hypothetical protein DEB28_02150 [Hyphomonas sp.]|nr:hypothetical protein [Hyphomonas sp.]
MPAFLNERQGRLTKFGGNEPVDQIGKQSAYSQDCYVIAETILKHPCLRSIKAQKNIDGGR